MNIEEQNAKNRKRSIDKNWVTFLTVLISLAAVIVSAIQIGVAKLSHDKGIKISQIQKQKELELAKLEKERRWNLDIANFIANHRDFIFTEDKKQRETMRNVLMITFPPEVMEVIFEKLENAVPEDEQETWKEGRKLAQISKMRVSLQYNSSKDEKLVNRLAENLRNYGYHLTNVWVNKNKTKGDVRYFNQSDRLAGKEIESIVEKFLNEEGINIDIALLFPKPYEGKVRSGTIEIWLPEINEK